MIAALVLCACGDSPSVPLAGSAYRAPFPENTPANDLLLDPISIALADDAVVVAHASETRGKNRRNPDPT